MRNVIIALAALALIGAPAIAADVRAIDGDTVVIAGEHIRLANIDTPEIRHAQCDAERRLGLVAKRRMAELIGAGALQLERGDHGRMKDRYGRSLARMAIGGRDIGDIMIAEGLARKWDGKRHP